MQRPGASQTMTRRAYGFHSPQATLALIVITSSARCRRHGRRGYALVTQGLVTPAKPIRSHWQVLPDNPLA